MLKNLVIKTKYQIRTTPWPSLVRATVVPLNMKNYINILLFLSVSIIACAGKDYVVVTGDGLIHPILKMEVVDIPSTGTVTCINGDAEIKKDGINEYVPIEVDLHKRIRYCLAKKESQG